MHFSLRRHGHSICHTMVHKVSKRSSAPLHKLQSMPFGTRKKHKKNV